MTLEPVPQSEVLHTVAALAAALDADHLRKFRTLIDEKLARFDAEQQAKGAEQAKGTEEADETKATAEVQ